METIIRPAGIQRTPRTSLGCLVAFLSPFFIVGTVLLGLGLRHLHQGATRDGLLMTIFSIVFIGSAGMFLAWGVRSHRRNRAQQQLEAEHPTAPWLWRPDWRAGRIRSTESRQAALLWIMAVASIGMSLPAVLAIPEEWAKGNKPILVALAFPLAGLGLGVAASRATIRRRKFGQSELELHTLPGVLGGTLSGALEVPSKIRTDTGFKLRLVCLRRTRSGSGRNRSTREKVLWEEQKTLRRSFLEAEVDRTGLPVFFNIPFDQPESATGNPAIVWRLEAAAEVPGVDYAAQFEVPVFRTEDSRADAVPAPDPTEPFQPASQWEPPTDTRVRLESVPGGETRIHFPAARGPGVILGLAVFIALWTGAIGFMITRDAPLIFPIVFALFDALLIVFALRMLFHSVRVTAGRLEVEILHRFLFLTWRHRIPAVDLRKVDLRIGMQSGTRVFYDLRLHTAAGRSYAAGGRVPDKKHAEWLAARLRQAAGLTP